MHPALAVACLLAGIAAMHWGVARIVDALRAGRARWGLTAVAGGALVGAATALPETSLNVASTAFEWPELGLGAALGSNLPAVPLAFVVAYASMRWHRRAGADDRGTPTIAVEADAVWRHALPYLAALGLVALLTLPPPIEGLQPVDAGILIAAWAVYMLQAVLRGRSAAEPGGFGRWRSVGLGAAAIAGGGVLAVLGSERINQALGVSDFAGGLFITGMLCALPESFSAWRLAREGRATMALSGVLADGATSISLAFVPLCLAQTDVQDKAVYAMNLAFIALFVAAYVTLSGRAFAGRRFSGAQVAIFVGLYAAYLASYVLLAGR